jgi:prevent-host-death family protein
MEVAISALRRDLANYIDRAKAGEEVVVTEHGTPVVRLVAVDAAPLIDQLVQQGVLGKAAQPGRPTAVGARRVKASGPVADLVSEQRG